MKARETVEVRFTMYRDDFREMWNQRLSDKDREQIMKLSPEIQRTFLAAQLHNLERGSNQHAYRERMDDGTIVINRRN